MRLRDLSQRIPNARVVAGPDVEISRAAYDSRRVEPGDLFVAIAGRAHHGASFVPDVLARGAVAVAAEQEVDVPPGRGLLVVTDARAALGDLASALLDRPSEKLRLVGVTGTDGKTTTVRLIAHVLVAAGRRVGWLTTIDIRILDQVEPNPFGRTTPESSDLHQLLARFVEAGVEDAIVEVSSHALAMQRVRGCTFDAAVFTNLSPEHLDFHGSMDAYATTKARLFETLDSPTAKRWDRMGVVNADDPASVVMAASSPAGIVSYAIDTPADVTAAGIESDLSGTRFTLVTPIGEVDVETRLAGRHNVYNWLAAGAVALGWGVDLAAVAEAAETAEPPPGRLQRVRRGQPFEVIVDFAHTPGALEATLAAVQPAVAGRLLVVFGMAGGRYVPNRRRMGELAARSGAFSVFTTDDPLHEDPAAIAGEIAEGARAAGAVEGRDFAIVLDRRQAIEEALRQARPGDVVLLAAKGHERRMLVGDEAVPWSDQEAAEDALASLGYDSGIGA